MEVSATMRAIEAVNTSVWASASHPSGRSVSGHGYKHTLGFQVAIPQIGLSLEFRCENSLIEALQELGLDDNTWTPDGPEGLYDVIDIGESNDN